MKKLIYLIALLSLIGCNNESIEIDNDNDSGKNESETLQSIDGFNCYIDFTEKKYTIKVFKEKEFIFEISNELTDRKQYIDLQYGRKKEILVSNIQIYNILQYQDTFYLLINLSENNEGEKFWGIREFYFIEKNATTKKIFNSSVFLPTTMRFWFENSLFFSANSAVYPEASISEPRIYDSQFNLISNQYHSGKVLDVFHIISVNGGKNAFDSYDPNIIIYKDIRKPEKNVWKFDFRTLNNDFIINEWDASYTSNNSISVTIDITYKNGERERLEYKLDKETGFPVL